MFLAEASEVMEMLHAAKFVHWLTETPLADIPLVVALLEMIVGAGGIVVALGLSFFTMTTGHLAEGMYTKLLILAVFTLILHTGVVNWRRLHR